MPPAPSHSVMLPVGRDRDLTDREKLVLTLLRRNGPMSRSVLIRETGLSGTAIFRVTEDLVAAGHIRLGEPIREGRGQPSNLVELQPRSVYSLGFSVMTDTAEAVIMDLSGAVLARSDITGSDMSRDAVLDKAADFLEQTVNRLGLSPDRLQAIGLALAGFFTRRANELNPAEALDDWALRDLRADVEARFSRPCLVENFANAAAIGEQLVGAGQNFRSFAYVSVASGFGGGYVLNGSPWRGAFGNAGEFAALLKHAGCAVPHLESLRAALSKAGVATESVRDLVSRYDPDWPGLEDWIAANAGVFRLLALLIHYSVDVEAVIIGGRLPTDLARRIAVAAAIDPSERSARIRRGEPHPEPQLIAAETGPASAATGAAALPLAVTYFTSLAQFACK